MEKKKFRQTVIEKRWRQLRNRASMSESEHKTKKKADSISAVRLSLIYVDCAVGQVPVPVPFLLPGSPLRPKQITTELPQGLQHFHHHYKIVLPSYRCEY